MSVILEQTIGNAVIRIHDDCCQDTSEETVREILRHVSAYVGAETEKSAPVKTQPRNR